MLAIMAVLASTANAAALRDKDIHLMQRLASELAEDLSKISEDTKQAELDMQGTSSLL